MWTHKLAAARPARAGSAARSAGGRGQLIERAQRQAPPRWSSPVRPRAAGPSRSRDHVSVLALDSLPTVGPFSTRFSPSSSSRPALARHNRGRVPASLKVSLVNGRLSPRSWSIPALQPSSARSCLDRVAAQTLSDLDRFLALGADRDRVAVCGNMKFDLIVLWRALTGPGGPCAVSGGASPCWWRAARIRGEEAVVATSNCAAAIQAFGRARPGTRAQSRRGSHAHAWAYFAPGRWERAWGSSACWSTP